jgi:hypothetical protein
MEKEATWGNRVLLHKHRSTTDLQKRPEMLWNDVHEAAGTPKACRPFRTTRSSCGAMSRRAWPHIKDLLTVFWSIQWSRITAICVMLKFGSCHVSQKVVLNLMVQKQSKKGNKSNFHPILCWNVLICHRS